MTLAVFVILAILSPALPLAALTFLSLLVLLVLLVLAPLALTTLTTLALTALPLTATLTLTLSLPLSLSLSLTLLALVLSFCISRFSHFSFSLIGLTGLPVIEQSKCHAVWRAVHRQRSIKTRLFCNRGAESGALHAHRIIDAQRAAFRLLSGGQLVVVT